MSLSQAKRFPPKFILSVVVVFLILASLAFFVIDQFIDEERDYALNKEMFTLVRELDTYKKSTAHIHVVFQKFGRLIISV